MRKWGENYPSAPINQPAVRHCRPNRNRDEWGNDADSSPRAAASGVLGFGNGGGDGQRCTCGGFGVGEAATRLSGAGTGGREVSAAAWRPTAWPAADGLDWNLLVGNEFISFEDSHVQILSLKHVGFSHIVGESVNLGHSLLIYCRTICQSLLKFLVWRISCLFSRLFYLFWQISFSPVFVGRKWP